MCGIFGIACSHDSDIVLKRSALNVLNHRGPDQWNEYFDKKVYLGHQRLSILDLSENGKQPIISDNGMIILTVNGEIYNFKHLKKQLKKKYIFKSSSDSEVLLFGYMEWGIKGLLKKIEGMFGFALYDKEKKKIFLVRDRVGIKPLFYSLHNNTVAWASELKAIKHYYGTLSVDNTALYDFLTYLYIPTPKTCYQDVYKLEPGHYLEVCTHTLKTEKHRYWDIHNFNGQAITFEKAAERLRHLIGDSVASQMMSDVPVGFFLSGGLDSSTVVAEASGKYSNLRTFTIGFEHSENNETHYAALVAERYGTNHVERILEEASAGNLYEKMLQWYDEPYADDSALPSYLVARVAKEKVTVVLTGDGGDEVFAGYNWYKRYVDHRKILPGFMHPVFSRIKRNARRYSKIYRILNQLDYRTLDGIELYAKLMGGLTGAEKRAYARKFSIPKDYDDYWYFRKYYRKELSPVKRLQYLDFKTYLHDDILTKVDRVSMAVSLEARVPLLDTQIIEFCFSLPEEFHYHNGTLKRLLKQAYTGILPKEILDREKKGFAIPAKKWDKTIVNTSKSKQERILSDFLAGTH